LEFADAVEDRDAAIAFKMQSRVDLMTPATTAAFRRSGCTEVWVGVESGAQKILNAMEKGIRVDQVPKARENLRKEGIRACYFLQFGYPGETWEDIQSTVKLVRDTRPDDIGVSVAYPLPGTKFFQQVQAQLGMKTNWSDSEDLSMMFKGAYAGEFYRALHDALHAEVDSWNGKAGGSHPEELWERVVQLERTSRTPNPTKLDDSHSGSLVQLQLQSDWSS
jgi:radical SAM superfamily enzyme YgiQ (UPF0313 family)